jgi:CheY-like chemotaxis protein
MARILVVEDESLIREFIADELKDAGFEVECSPNGDQALQLVKSGACFDLLFTDIRMPGAVDGWELGRNVSDLVPDMPIVYVTGYSDKAPTLRNNEAFLKKPYCADDVLTMISGMGIRA